MEDIIDELAAAGTIEVEPPVSVQDAISKTEMRKHSNRESARRSYQRRRKRNRELEQENERLREGLELARLYTSLIPLIPAQNEEVARRDATPAPALVGVALPSMAAVPIGAELGQAVVEAKAPPSTKKRAVVPAGGVAPMCHPRRQHAPRTSAGPPVLLAAPLSSSSSSSLLLETAASSPAFTPPDSAVDTLPEAIAHKGDYTMQARPAQIYPWSHVREGPNFLGPMAGYPASTDHGHHHWITVQQKKLAQQQQYAQQRLERQQLAQRQALHRQFLEQRSKATRTAQPPLHQHDDLLPPRGVVGMEGAPLAELMCEQPPPEQPPLAAESGGVQAPKTKTLAATTHPIEGATSHDKLGFVPVEPSAQDCPWGLAGDYFDGAGNAGDFGWSDTEFFSLGEPVFN